MSLVVDRDGAAASPALAAEPAAGADPAPARRRPARRIPGWAVATASLALFVALWWTVARLGVWDPIFVPPPEQVLQKLVETSTVHDGQVGYGGHFLWEHLWVTLRRILISAALAIAIGVPLGLAIGLVPFLRHALGPAITFLRQLPPLAYFSLLIIWFGIDESPKLVLLVIAAMPPIIVATAAGIEGVNKDYVHAAQSLGAHRINLIRTVLLPASLPDIFTGIRLGVGVAYTSVVAAETVNGLPGIGGMIRDAQRYNQTSVVILGIIVLGLTGLLIELLLSRLQSRLTPWRGRA
jgi:taurine transport system permease protein